MENTVGSPDDGKVVQGDDLEQKVVGLGLHRQKESEGDDVFEEAVGAVITYIDSEGIILENNGGGAGVTEKVDVSVTEESSLEKEEPWVTPREILNGFREESGEKGKLLVTEEESQIASEPEEVSSSSVREEEVKHHRIVENGEDTIEKPNLKDEVNETSKEVTEKPLNGVVHMIEEEEDVDIDKQGKEVKGLLETQDANEVKGGHTEENDETREKLQMIRVKFLRLALRLGQTPHNDVVAKVLYRIGLAEQFSGRAGGHVAAFSFDRASAMAEQLESAGQEPLDFSCTIMVLGKTGVGKSATINSIFDEAKLDTDPFQRGTKKVQDVVGTVQGIKVRIIDTPGLLPCWSDQRQNEKTLQSVKRFIKKTPPDIVLYLDRLDMQSPDLGDMPLLRTITKVFGPSIWFNAIFVLTHAASAPLEGPNGDATSYDTFVTQKYHAVQQAIRRAAGDMQLMNHFSLVENHSACKTNRAGQRVLPNGQVWKPDLLLLSVASKIWAEAKALLKLQDIPRGRPFQNRALVPPLDSFLSCLLQSRPQVKLTTDQYDDDDSSDSEDESEYEYDQLPPFRSLTKAQLGKLPKDQREAYYSELEYREKLLMKKLLKEKKKQRKTKNVQKADPDPMRHLVYPDNPTHQYQSRDLSLQWRVEPVLDPNGPDHDVGCGGLLEIKDKVPVSFCGQVSTNKKNTQLQMEVASSIKHGDGKATCLFFDMQSVEKNYTLYTLRGESKFMNYRRNKMTGGGSVSVLGDTLSGGVKLEDKLVINKRGQVVVAGGAMYSQGSDVTYGGSLEATLRDKDLPVGQSTNLIGQVSLNNEGSGQVSIRLNSSDHLQLVLIALIPIARKLLWSLGF